MCWETNGNGFVSESMKYFYCCLKRSCCVHISELFKDIEDRVIRQVFNYHLIHNSRCPPLLFPACLCATFLLFFFYKLCIIQCSSSWLVLMIQESISCFRFNYLNLTVVTKLSWQSAALNRLGFLRRRRRSVLQRAEPQVSWAGYRLTTSDLSQ